MNNDVRQVALALRDYIDAIPAHIELGETMPGIDRDWVDSVLDDPSTNSTI